MKNNFLVVLLGAALLATGCVDTVTGRKTVGVPLVKDKIESRYERSVDQCFQAAKEAIRDFGVLSNEGTLLDQTNLVRTVEGRVNQRTVWVRIEQLDPRITSVITQARNSSGGTDIDLTAQIDKHIALKLVR